MGRLSLHADGLPTSFTPASRCYIYCVGGDEPVPLFEDPDLTQGQANPLIADENGDFRLCYVMDGSYRIQLRDQFGKLLADVDDVCMSAAKELGFAGSFSDVDAVLADRVFSYSDGAGQKTVRAGDLLRSEREGIKYVIAPQQATDAHMQTAGGVKLYVKPGANGFDVRAFGAKGDGSSDDTVAIQAALDLASMAGGKVFLTEGQFLANLEVVAGGSPHCNLTLHGAGGGSSLPGATSLSPFDPSRPALQIGRAGKDTRDVTVENLGIFATSASDQLGLVLENAYRCSFRNLQVNGFTDANLSITSKTGGQSAYLYFDNLSVIGYAPGDCVRVSMGETYTTAVYFSNCDLSSTTGGSVLDADGVQIALSNLWIQAKHEAGLKLRNGSKVIAQNVSVDSENSTDVLVEIDSNTPLSNHFVGTITVDGKVRYQDGTSRDFVPLSMSAHHARLPYPSIEGRMNFSDMLFSAGHEQDAADQDVSIYRYRDILTLETASQNIRARPGSGVFEIRAANGPYLRLQSDTTQGAARIFVAGSDLIHRCDTGAISLWANGQAVVRAAPGYFVPEVDNSVALGNTWQRFSQVFATNGVISTSDRRQKTDIRPLSEAEQAVAGRVKPLIRAFRWKDGATEQTQIGVIAQDLCAAFEAEGLDPFAYGVVYRGQSTEEEEPPLGVRYDQLMCFVLSAL